MASKSTIVRTIQTLAPMASVLAPPLAGRWLATLFCTPQKRPIPPRELEWLEGSTFSLVTYDEKISLPVWSWGTGPTVMLVHGWSGRGAQLAVMAEPLVKAGFRVVTFDLPAHGQAGGKLAALPMFARAVRLVSEQTGPVHGVISHSLGTAGVTMAMFEGLLIERALYLAPPENLPLYLQQAGAYLGFRPGIATHAQKHLEKLYGIPFDQMRAPVYGPQMTANLLVVHDDTDKEVDLSEGHQLVRHWPGSRLIVTHGHGHHRLVRRPETVELAVEFMAGALKKQRAV
nr:alpha/beta hydrolase [Candidatus Krumholzibacteria bacterium]